MQQVQAGKQAQRLFPKLSVRKGRNALLKFMRTMLSPLNADGTGGRELYCNFMQMTREKWGRGTTTSSIFLREVEGGWVCGESHYCVRLAVRNPQYPTWLMSFKKKKQKLLKSSFFFAPHFAQLYMRAPSGHRNLAGQEKCIHTRLLPFRLVRLIRSGTY